MHKDNKIWNNKAKMDFFLPKIEKKVAFRLVASSNFTPQIPQKAILYIKQRTTHISQDTFLCITQNLRQKSHDNRKTRELSHGST